MWRSFSMRCGRRGRKRWETTGTNAKPPRPKPGRFENEDFAAIRPARCGDDARR